MTAFKSECVVLRSQVLICDLQALSSNARSRWNGKKARYILCDMLNLCILSRLVANGETLTEFGQKMLYFVL